MDSLTEDDEVIKSHVESKKAMVLKHRDMEGRPVIYIPAKFHNVNDRDIDQLTKFIVYCLVSCTKHKSFNYGQGNQALLILSYLNFCFC